MTQTNRSLIAPAGAGPRMSLANVSKGKIEELLPRLDDDTQAKARQYLEANAADPAKLAQLADRVRSKAALAGSEGAA